VCAIDPAYQFFVFGDVALAFHASTQVTVSPLVLALTISRLFDGTNLPAEEVIAAEILIGQADASEREVLGELSAAFTTEANPKLGLHYRLWQGQTLLGVKNFLEAKRQFNEILRLGFDQWRIHWYLALASHGAGDTRFACVILDTLMRLVPEFSRRPRNAPDDHAGFKARGDTGHQRSAAAAAATSAHRVPGVRQRIRRDRAPARGHRALRGLRDSLSAHAPDERSDAEIISKLRRRRIPHGAAKIPRRGGKSCLGRDYFQQEILQFIEPGGGWLDVGCGWGGFLLNARAKGFTPRGIELTRKCVEYANTNLAFPSWIRSLRKPTSRPAA